MEQVKTKKKMTKVKKKKPRKKKKRSLSLSPKITLNGRSFGITRQTKLVIKNISYFVSFMLIILITSIISLLNAAVKRH